ncbi:MAG: helix-turn-helix transcriptional regulator [Anaerolineae bacterium]|nr:helix-turn-helix transcriptional regulator [Anaerolineae bacterium]
MRFLEPTLLLLLHHDQAHGYTLMADLDAFGLADIDTSAVYRALREMEERGWVTSYWEEEQTQGPPRRIYELTRLGDEVLRWWTSDLADTARVIDHFLRTYKRHMAEGKGAYHE